MKKLSYILFIGVMMFTASCEKYLDINENPNQATSATPELILPLALTATASNVNGFNSYGAQLGGYMANAGGYGGFGANISYLFTASNYSARWSATYDNLEDYQSIINATEGKETYNYFNGVARIMRAYGFQLLVDAYNDVPYTDALKGADVLSPAYTKGEDIYKDLASQLDKAIATITAGEGVPGITPLGASDIMFKNDMTKWKQFANTLKLRIIVRGNAKVQFANKNFSNDGFLSTDALINPGFTRDASRQNPKWDTWAFSYTGNDATKSWMPTTFILTFYNGNKLIDNGRGAATYYKYPNTPTNQLGNESTTVEKSPGGSFWYPSDVRTGSTGNATGTLKGPEAGLPVITAAESYFLQAEGVVRGILTAGSAETLFNNGIKASFRYLYTLPDNKTFKGNPDADAATYMVDNATSRLVNFSLATTTEQKVEAIITQKYIAMNMVNSEEGWNEYRRTHYPVIVNSPGATATQTFASKVSEATSPDRLPTRILYPTSEGSYNATNVPKNISPITSKIFWAL